MKLNLGSINIGNLLGGLIGGQAAQRIDHVKEADMPGVLADLNAKREAAGKPDVDESDWRLFEQTQAEYVAGKIVKQVAPKA